MLTLYINFVLREVETSRFLRNASTSVPNCPSQHLAVHSKPPSVLTAGWESSRLTVTCKLRYIAVVLIGDAVKRQVSCCQGHIHWFL